MRLRPTLGLLALATLAQAQPSARKGVTVTGHVYCADTNAPARLATVALEPVSVLEPARERDTRPLEQKQFQFTAVQTGVDGSFAIPHVLPGDYYVVAEKPGYISPFASLRPDSLLKLTTEERQARMRLLPRITVQPALPASVDVRLERGAAISGTVLFDDGTPAAGLPVHALTLTKQGDQAVWELLPSTAFPIMASQATDDQGHYRLAGLGAGDYILEVDLSLSQFEFAVSNGMEGTSTSGDAAKLAVYSGGTTRRREAKPLKLGTGDEAGQDITIPVSKLHTIGGELTAAHDGHVINHGDVELFDSEDKTIVESATVARDGRFDLRFVPEGDYLLRVDGAADVTYEDVPYPPGTMPPTHEVVHIVHTYGEAEQPLSVHEDVAGTVIAIPEKAPAAAGASSP